MMEVRDAWGEVLRNHLTDYRLEVDREVQSKKMAVENVLDLGSKFNDPRLNQKVPYILITKELISNKNQKDPRL